VHVAIHDPARQPQAALRRWRVENEQDLLAACLPRYEWGTAENGFQHLSVRRAVDAEADSQLALLDVQPKKEHTSATHILRLTSEARPPRGPAGRARAHRDSTVMLGWLCRGRQAPRGRQKMPRLRSASSCTCRYVTTRGGLLARQRHSAAPRG